MSRCCESKIYVAGFQYDALGSRDLQIAWLSSTGTTSSVDLWAERYAQLWMGGDVSATCT